MSGRDLAVTAEKPAAFLRGRQHLPIAARWQNRNERGGVTAGTRLSSKTAAIIVMAGSLLGLFASSLFWSSFSPYGRGGTVVRGCGRVARGRRQRATPPASRQDDLDPLSLLNRHAAGPVPLRGFLASLLGESGST
jgi:hypothetical protein